LRITGSISTKWVVISMTDMKKCKYHPEKRCYHSSCSIFDSRSGNVVLCPLFHGGELFTPRKVGVVLHGVFDKRFLRRGGFEG